MNAFGSIGLLEAGTAEEEALKMVEVCDNPILRIDRDGQVVRMNAAAERILELERHHLLGYPAERVLGEEGVEVLSGIVSSREASGGQHDLALYRSDGERVVLPASVMLVHEGGEALLQVLFSSTQSIDLERDLVRIHGQASLGAMAAEVGHELNNHLLVLGGYAQLLPLHMDRQEWDKVRRDASMIVDEVERAKVLTEGLIHFSPREDSLRTTDVNEVIRLSHGFLRPLNRFDNIELELDLSDGLVPAAVGRSSLQQLLVNLLNASADMLGKRQGEGGAITISTTGREAGVVLRIENRPNRPRDPDTPVTISGALNELVARRIVESVGATLTVQPDDVAIGVGAEVVELGLTAAPLLAEELVPKSEFSG